MTLYGRSLWAVSQWANAFSVHSWYVIQVSDFCKDSRWKNWPIFPKLSLFTKMFSPCVEFLMSLDCCHILLRPKGKFCWVRKCHIHFCPCLFFSKIITNCAILGLDLSSPYLMLLCVFVWWCVFFFPLTLYGDTTFSKLASLSVV